MGRPVAKQRQVLHAATDARSRIIIGFYVAAYSLTRHNRMQHRNCGCKQRLQWCNTAVRGRG